MTSFLIHADALILHGDADVAIVPPAGDFDHGAGKGFYQASSGSPWSTGFEQSDIMFGWMNDYQVGRSNGYYHTRSWENGFYGQDDYRVNNRLVLNLGLRYDMYTWPTEINNRMANFDLATGHIFLAGQNGVSDSTLENPKHDFAPRIGFAYDLHGDQKSVFRGGYGIFYFIDREGIDKQMSENAPFGGSAYYSYANGFFGNGLLTLGGIAQQGPNGAPIVSSITATGFPSKQTLAIDLNNPANVSLTGWLPSNTTSRVQEWNLQYQRQLDAKTALTLAYVGTKGSHLSTFYDVNRPAYDTGVKPYPLLGTVPVNDTSGTSLYNGAHVQVQRRMSRGLQFDSSYTWSHAIDNAPAGFDSDYRYGGNVVDPFQWQTKERANSNLDVRSRFVVSALYEVPFGRGRAYGGDWNPAVDAIAGGWRISPIVNIESGFPFDVVCQYCYSPSTRPNLIGPLHQIGSTQEWFDTTAFQRVPTSGSGTPIAPGDAPRNPFTGPATKDVDLNIAKTFRFAERVHAELSGDIFNLFNHPQFSQPDGNLNDGGNFGKITSLRYASEREIQVSFRVSF